MYGRGFSFVNSQMGPNLGPLVPNLGPFGPNLGPMNLVFRQMPPPVPPVSVLAPTVIIVTPPGHVTVSRPTPCIHSKTASLCWVCAQQRGYTAAQLNAVGYRAIGYACNDCGYSRDRMGHPLSIYTVSTQVMQGQTSQEQASHGQATRGQTITYGTLCPHHASPHDINTSTCVHSSQIFDGCNMCCEFPGCNYTVRKGTGLIIYVRSDSFQNRNYR
jgi:hypothetical protein